jgi:hypothetical protein
VARHAEVESGSFSRRPGLGQLALQAVQPVAQGIGTVALAAERLVRAICPGAFAVALITEAVDQRDGACKLLAKRCNCGCIGLLALADGRNCTIARNRGKSLCSWVVQAGWPRQRTRSGR